MRLPPYDRQRRCRAVAGFPPFQTPGDRAAAIAFFGDRDAAHGLFHHLVSRLAGRVGPFGLAATKSRVSCVARTRFLWVHEAHADGSIWIGFLLPHALDSPRLRSGRLPGGRWSHHARLDSEADVDDELLGWLAEAYETDAAGIEDPAVKVPKAPRAKAKPRKAAKAKVRR